VPHTHAQSIANNEPPPRKCCGPHPSWSKAWCVSPARLSSRPPSRLRGSGHRTGHARIQGEAHEYYVARMLEVLRRARCCACWQPDRHAQEHAAACKTLALSAEAVVLSTLLGRKRGSEIRNPKSEVQQPVAILFGPEKWSDIRTVGSRSVDEAGLKHYTRLT